MNEEEYDWRVISYMEDDPQLTTSVYSMLSNEEGAYTLARNLKKKYSKYEVEVQRRSRKWTTTRMVT